MSSLSSSSSISFRSDSPSPSRKRRICEWTRGPVHYYLGVKKQFRHVVQGQCDRCDHWFKLDALKGHRRRCMPHECTVCLERFPSPQTLTKHTCDT